MRNVVPAGLIIVAVIFAVYAGGFVGSDGVWALKLFVVAAVVAAAGVGLFFVNPQLRANLSLSVAILVVGLFGIEGVLVAIAQREPDVEPGFDKRTPLEVVRDLRARGVEAVPALYATYALREHRAGEILPLGGISTATTVFCNESGKYVLYESDEHGFNNPRGLPPKADVVVLGDSFAHGQCVERGEEIAGRLRARGISARSLASSGNGPLLELATLVEYGLSYSPGVVLWLYYEGNDLGDLASELRHETLRMYLRGEGTQKLGERQAEIDTFWKKYLSATNATAPYSSPKAIARQIVRLEYLRTRLGLRRLQQGNIGAEIAPVFARAKLLAEKNAAKIIIVYLPSWERFHAPNFEDRRPELRKIAADLNIKLIDFAEVMARDADRDRFYHHRRMGHFNAEGYAVLAEVIAEALGP